MLFYLVYNGQCILYFMMYLYMNLKILRKGLQLSETHVFNDIKRFTISVCVKA